MTRKAKNSVKYTIDTHEAERVTPSSEAIRLCEQIAEGHISGDKAVDQLKRNYGMKSM